MITAFTSHASVTGILYAEDFDAPPPVLAPVAAEPIEVPAECFDRAALDDARQDGFLAGRRAAEADARAAREARSEAILSALLDKLADTRADLRNQQIAFGQALLTLTTATLDAILPVTMREHGPAEAEAALAAILPSCDPHWDLSVHLHPDTISDARHRYPTLNDKITWQADPALAPGDLRVAWRHGEFRRDSAAILSAVRAAWPALITDISIPENAIPAEEPSHVAGV